MIIGFTGSRRGLSKEQMAQVNSVLIQHQATHLHHGDCVGSDEGFHRVGEEMANVSITIHPPDKPGLRAFCDPQGEGVKKLPLPFLKRNHAIVDACDILIACPETNQEQLRSGTWATIRYARKKGKEVIIIPQRII